MSRHLVHLFLFYLLFNTGVTDVYSQKNAFQELSVGVYLGQSLGGNELSNRWEAKPGIQLNFQTPFYAGTLDGGIRHSRFNSSENFPTYSDFQSTFIYLGWAYTFDLFKRLSAGPALRFGNTLFQYDEAKLYPSPGGEWAYNFDTSESEFSYEILFRSEYKIVRQWKAHAEISYNRTLTYHPMQLSFVTVGFSYSFDTPAWFQKVFK